MDTSFYSILTAEEFFLQWTDGILICDYTKFSRVEAFISTAQPQSLEIK